MCVVFNLNLLRIFYIWNSIFSSSAEGINWELLSTEVYPFYYPQCKLSIAQRDFHNCSIPAELPRKNSFAMETFRYQQDYTY